MACTDLLWRTISFTAAGEKQSPTMLSERDTRGGTDRDFSTPLETRIQKESPPADVTGETDPGGRAPACENHLAA